MISVFGHELHARPGGILLAVVGDVEVRVIRNDDNGRWLFTVYGSAFNINVSPRELGAKTPEAAARKAEKAIRLALAELTQVRGRDVVKATSASRGRRAKVPKARAT